ncbi:MAG: hypothetical protein QOI13_3243, partial [Paraburkholderia sp.]|nr:hypothetical protein [Paraburkholderia sp.]
RPSSLVTVHAGFKEEEEEDAYRHAAMFANAKRITYNRHLREQ